MSRFLDQIRNAKKKARREALERAAQAAGAGPPGAAEGAPASAAKPVAPGKGTGADAPGGKGVGPRAPLFPDDLESSRLQTGKPREAVPAPPKAGEPLLYPNDLDKRGEEKGPAITTTPAAEAPPLYPNDLDQKLEEQAPARGATPPSMPAALYPAGIEEGAPPRVKPEEPPPPDLVPMEAGEPKPRAPERPVPPKAVLFPKEMDRPCPAPAPLAGKEREMPALVPEELSEKRAARSTAERAREVRAEPALVSEEVADEKRSPADVDTLRDIRPKPAPMPEEIGEARPAAPPSPRPAVDVEAAETPAAATVSRGTPSPRQPGAKVSEPLGASPPIEKAPSDRLREPPAPAEPAQVSRPTPSPRAAETPATPAGAPYPFAVPQAPATAKRPLFPTELESRVSRETAEIEGEPEAEELGPVFFPSEETEPVQARKAGAAGPVRRARRGQRKVQQEIAVLGPELDPEYVKRIAKIAPRPDPRVLSFYDPKHHVCEEYRLLGKNVLHTFATGQPPSRRGQVLTLSSSVRGEGKTLTCVNLAVTLAQDLGDRILLIDGDLRHPRVHYYVGVPAGAGFNDLLTSSDPASVLEDCILRTDFGLHLLLTTPSAKNPSPLLDSDRLTRVLDLLRERYALIVVDTPPVLLATDALTVGSRSDGMLFLLRARKTQREQIQEARQRIARLDIRLVGYVINNVKSFLPRIWSRYYYGNY
ncbi:MAG TPA: polysaccharide biosynthesis tyrosine autokinase [Sumerlaeia bacterium]|nr:polysaccharide biosynthesis tyrosine autokinase [Sumerlaeia bacterium]